MIKNGLYVLMGILFFIACSKKEVLPTKDGEPIDQWERFIGNYYVYDTLGNYMYNMDIAHYSTTYYQNGQKTDSLIITNFADTFDLKFTYSGNSVNHNILSIGGHDSLVDYNNKHWYVGDLADDLNTHIRENTLFNDTIIFYFKQDNIKFYINEAQPYYMCECKHVAVKQ